MSTPPTIRAKLARQRRAFDLALGARIRDRRADACMSQQKLARALGISYQSVQKYEAGRNAVRAAVLCEIAAALNVHVGELLP